VTPAEAAPHMTRVTQSTSGRHQRIRRLIAVALVGVFFAVPWIQMGGMPLARFELQTGRYFLFGKALPASSLTNVVLLVLAGSLLLGFVSSVFGRLWCGYACPQGVFVDLGVRLLERIFEGPPLARARLARTRSFASRVARRAGVHISLGILSTAFAFGIMAFFAAPEDLLAARSGTHTTLLAVGGAIAALAYVDGAFLRHKFCTTICPYARLQSLFVDEGTRTIGYAHGRGEPRGRGRATLKAFGDCIDCNACVRVCPTGIDIRDGAGQLECVNCARCIDVCNGVMTSLGRPTGLIRYDTELGFSRQNSAESKDASIPRPRLPRLRARPVLYASAVAVTLGVGLFRFVTLPAVQGDAVNVTPNGFAREGARVKNLLRVRISNMANRPAAFVVRLAAGASPDTRIEFSTPTGIIAPGGSANTNLLVSKDADAATSSRIDFAIESTGEPELQGRFSVRFSAPRSPAP